MRFHLAPSPKLQDRKEGTQIAFYFYPETFDRINYVPKVHLSEAVPVQNHPWSEMSSLYSYLILLHL